VRDLVLPPCCRDAVDLVKRERYNDQGKEQDKPDNLGEGIVTEVLLVKYI